MTGNIEFKRLFRESFREPSEWVDWFCSHVFREEDFVTICNQSGEAVSGLLLQPYEMLIHGRRLPIGYISCVATLRAERGKGLAHMAMAKALHTARERGMALCTLIPASDRLYFFYDGLGFSTVFYVDELRYTSAHVFDSDEAFTPAEPVYEIMERLEAKSPCGVLHSRRDFENLKHDLENDGGLCVAVKSEDGREAIAMAAIGECITVKEILATDAAAAEAALAILRREAGEKMVIVWSRPGERPFCMRSRGMARIVDAGKLLGTLAAADTKLHYTIRIHDSILPENAGIYHIHDGICEKLTDAPGKVDLDVNVEVLTRIIFSAPRIGNIFNLPTERPMMSMMLD